MAPRRIPRKHSSPVRGVIVRYILATVFVLGALALNTLPPAQETPFLFFFAAVTITARFCGFWPAVYATVLASGIADFFLFQPRYAFSFSSTDLMRTFFFILVCLLITSFAKEKSMAQREADENRARLAAIIEFSEDAILSKTLDGTITSWNNGAERMYGYTEAEVLGRHVGLLAAPELPDDIPTIMRKLREGGRVEHYQTKRRKKDGTTLDISVSVSPVYDSDGKIVGAATIARDITQAKAMEQTLRKTEKLAATGRLAASIAHEINNPLESVTNLLYLLRHNSSLDDKARTHLTFAEQELDRVAHIVKQTLGYYRDTSTTTAVEIGSILDSVLAIYARKLEGNSVLVNKRYKATHIVHGSTGEIRQVFSNLVANAIDAMPQGGQLTLATKNSHDFKNGNTPGVRILIADTGYGIAADQQKKLFQAFFTTKTDVGTGLGLWLSKNIVEKHGGSIKVRSNTGHDRSGTVFGVFLPVTHTEQHVPSYDIK
jgi:PAS domain S-box-containing protein